MNEWFKKVRVEGNSVIFINREILPGPEDARICFTLFKWQQELQWNSKKYSINNDYLCNTAVYFYLYGFWELKSIKAGIEAFKNSMFQYGSNVTMILTWQNLWRRLKSEDNVATSIYSIVTECK